MNIFFLDHATEPCAQAHANVHLASQIKEAAQMLSTALHEHGLGDCDDRLMKPTHVHHPMNVWVRETRQNFLHTTGLMVDLIREADYRFGALKRDRTVKHDRARHIAQVCVDMCNYLPATGMTPPPQCMPPDFQGPDTIEAYRTYYRVAKRGIATWTRRPPPDWWNEQ